MLKRIRNALFKIHVKRFFWYTDKWIWCWDHGAPVFVTELLVWLITMNAKTAAIYGDAVCSKDSVSQFLHTV